MRPYSPVLLFMSLSSCTDVADAPAESPPVDVLQPSIPRPEPTPTPPVEPVAATPVAAKPVAEAPVVGPPRLSVAFEGRCSGLAASVLDEQVFAHHVTREDLPRGSDFDYQEHIALVRLDANGQPVETLPEPAPHTADAIVALSGLDALVGRWPDQVYAAVGIGSRGDYHTGYIRFDGKAWTGVHPLGPSSYALGIIPWHERSIVAVTYGGEPDVLRLPVVRGAAKGPRTDKLSAALVSCGGARLVDVAAVPTGDLVALARCDDYTDGSVFGARWRPDDLAGEIERLTDPAFGFQRGFIAHDGKQDFWLALVGTSNVLIHNTPGRWDPVELPPGKGFADLAVDPGGAVWYLQPGGLWRREADRWVAEEVPLEGMRELLGVEQGTPWVRGTTVARGAAGGPWHRVELPSSVFFPGRRLEIDSAEVAGAEVDRAGDIWLDTNFTVVRKERTELGRYYGSVVTSRPVVRPLRCGQVLLAPMRAVFSPWPVGADASCQHPLVLLQPQTQWKPGNTYTTYARAMRGATDIGAPRFVELDLSGTLVFGAIVDSDPAAKALVARARKADRWQFPETVCGDPAALADADAKIVRELTLDLAVGTLSESSPAATPG